MAYATTYDRRNSDQEFAAAWASALEQGTDLLEDEARNRAVEGTEKPVFYKGEVCGSIVEKSDFLLYKTLVSRRRDKWSERQPGDAGNDQTVIIKVVGGLPSDEPA
jgi:hypothetical protein